MASCNALVGLAASCDDNNLGSIHQAWIADKSDVVSFTEAAGAVTAITMTALTYFVPFYFKKDTSGYTENRVGDMVADVHAWEQVVTLGLRRHETTKRNAIMLLAEGRRDLVIITRDNNDAYRVFGLDKGLRLSAMESGTNTERTAGTFYTLTFTAEAERWMAYSTTNTVVGTVLAP